MTTKKTKKKKSILKSRFYQIYFIVVAIALIAIAIGTAWLRGVLADYESAQPVYVAEGVAKLFEDKDYQRIYELDTSAAQIAGGDKAFYLESMAEIASGKAVEWSEAFSTNDDERKYSVTLDGEKFASFTLVPSGETTRRGNRLWKLGDVTTYVTRREPDPEPEATPEPTPTPQPTPRPGARYECSITVPSGSVVTVDGEALSEANAQVNPKTLFESGFLPEGVENPLMTEYLYGAYSETPAVEATDSNGAALSLKADAERERTWSCSIQEDEAMRQQYGEAAISLGKKIAKFMSKDGSKKGITKLCLRGSPAWEIFDNLSNRYATPHKGYDFRDAQVTEFYRLSDTCFTCRVTFDFILITEDGERVYPTAYTFCMANVGGKSGLYNLQIY